MLYHRAGFRAWRNPAWMGNDIQIVYYEKIGDRLAVSREVTMETHNPAIEVKPTFTLSYEAAQTLMDELWECGLRPTAGAGSAGQLAATERHLSDLQKLVFNLAEPQATVKKNA